jgi:hypothetical protein
MHDEVTDKAETEDEYMKWDRILGSQPALDAAHAQEEVMRRKRDK